ncbi:helix-turn-helix domain-containing protein [Nitrosomonas marina]|uniref:HTH cro/C1-type domain-containing protein n=1 Tax=Nitrosomonas marina TaxID=917 RepID=A0A1H8ISD1_9PROT|nr:helix-turn-helix transcriptional regulator [Nitrosomonas marina]SEN71573.1 hypothetical protein SAMN05216325_1401 [Nitrosomonas marina]
MDWKKIIKELMGAGLTQSQIASRCKTGQSNISGLLTGKRKSPSWMLGEHLRNLHKSVVKQKDDRINEDQAA